MATIAIPEEINYHYDLSRSMQTFLRETFRSLYERPTHVDPLELFTQCLCPGADKQQKWQYFEETLWRWRNVLIKTGI